MSVNFISELPYETQYEVKSNNCKTFKTDFATLQQELSKVVSNPRIAIANDVSIDAILPDGEVKRIVDKGELVLG